MLSVKKILAGRGAVNYYLDQTRRGLADYYLPDSSPAESDRRSLTAPGSAWWGGGAAALGLHGTVDRERFVPIYIASCTVPAVPTTSTFGSAFSASARPSATISWSSTTNTRIAAMTLSYLGRMVRGRTADSPRGQVCPRQKGADGACLLTWPSRRSGYPAATRERTIETFEQQLARVLDEQRRRRGLTAKDVADIARVDPATVRRVLAGRGARITTLRLVVSALELDWRDTLGTVARREPASQQA